ncbi:MAG: transglycosylase SLT domain-containing protein [Pseudomonadota bacterium]
MKVFLGAALILLSTPVLAAELFPLPSALEPNVRFWRRVYAEWPTNRYAIHDDQQLDIVYRVIAATDGREAKVKNAKAEIEDALGRLDARRPSSESGLTGAELEAFRALSGSSDPARFARARGHVRHQKGQRDRFAEALRTSGRYRPQIEKILVDHGLPRELLAVIYVESMFNTHARSFSGALGLWQFMPYTGREYLNINKVVDERRDPIIASYAAASYLRSAYKRLGAWPLAITSYNYGMNGMARAVKAVGTTEIATVLSSYRSGRLGFAAKNYYTEFLAALDVMQNPGRYFPEVTPASPWRYDVVRLPGATTVPALDKAGSVSAKDLTTLNPALNREALQGRVRLPAGMSLRIPRGRTESFVASLGSVRDLRRGDEERGRRYTVRGGDSITSIARRHGVTQGQLLAANHLARDATLYKGMNLIVPPKAAGYTLYPEAREMPVPELPAGVAVAARSVEPEPELEPEPEREPPKRVATAIPRAEVRTRTVREPPPPRRHARRVRLPGTRAIVLAGPVTADEGGAAAALEAEIAVDVLAGTMDLPAVDVVAGVPAVLDEPMPEPSQTPDAA